MNKAELIDLISDRFDLTKAVAARAVEAVIGGITAGLQEDGTVAFVNFGTFMVKNRAPRVGRNPSTGEEINIGPAKVVSFKAGKALKEAVKKEKTEA